MYDASHDLPTEAEIVAAVTRLQDERNGDGRAVRRPERLPDACGCHLGEDRRRSHGAGWLLWLLSHIARSYMEPRGLEDELRRLRLVAMDQSSRFARS